MDTRFWGPSGWKLLHIVSSTYKSKNSILYSKFFETIPYILPCKYCRFSLMDYYKEHPFPIGNHSLERWLYTIHNCVNDKLKKQGLHSGSNPSFAHVQKMYHMLCKESWTTQLQLCWDFLFAVGYNHPKDTYRNSTPMPDCPSGITRCKDKYEMNKWNVLPLKDRVLWYRRFWTSLPDVLPVEIATHWKETEKRNPATLESRRTTLAWLWRMRCSLDSNFKDPYTSICKKIASYSSDCGTKKHGITCRKSRNKNKNKHLNKHLLQKYTRKTTHVKQHP